MPSFFARKKSNGSQVSAILRSVFFRFDYKQLIPMFILLVVGVCFVYGIGQQVGGVGAEIYWRRQIQWAAVGLVLWLLMALFDYRKYGVISMFLWPLSIALLGIVLKFGVDRFGAKRWFSLFGFSIQPSEIAKLCTVVFLAWLLSRKDVDINKIKWFFLSLLILAIPAFLIFRQNGDLCFADLSDTPESALFHRYSAMNQHGLPPEAVHSFSADLQSGIFRITDCALNVTALLREIRRDAQEMLALIHEDHSVNSNDFPAEKEEHCTTCPFGMLCNCDAGKTPF